MASCCEPVECTLSTPEADDRLAEWSELRDAATSVEQLDDRVRLRFPATLAAKVRDLADRESQCCGFLDIDVTDHGDAVEMTIASTNPDGVPVIQVLAGLTEE